MQKVQFTPAWKKFSLALVVLLTVAVIVVWAKPTASTSPATVGAAIPVEASAAISPMELMIRRGHNLAPTDYAEPF
jgi:hypothetical protein